ncbi:type I restriction endonuclease, partial [Methylophaga sp. UBA3996]
MSQFTEAKLEQAIIELIEQQGYPYTAGETLVRDPSEVLIREDLEGFLRERYASEGLTDGELETIIRRLINFSSADLYDSNRAIHKLVADGFVLKRDDHTQKDLFIQLIDYEG